MQMTKLSISISDHRQNELFKTSYGFWVTYEVT